LSYLLIVAPVVVYAVGWRQYHFPDFLYGRQKIVFAPENGLQGLPAGFIRYQDYCLKTTDNPSANQRQAAPGKLATAVTTILCRA